jgi:hypothetical protein
MAPSVAWAQEEGGEEPDVAPGRGVGVGVFLFSGSSEGLGSLIAGGSGLSARWGMTDALVGELSGSFSMRSVDVGSDTGAGAGLLEDSQTLTLQPSLALYYAIPATTNARLLAGVRVSSANTWIKQGDGDWGDDLTWSVSGGPVVSGEYIAGGVLGVGFEAGLSIGYSAGDGVFDGTSVVGVRTNSRITMNYYF